MIPPTPSSKRVSGLYRGSADEFELDLRIDIDGARPTMRVSGDFFKIQGQSKLFNNSFVMKTLERTTTAGAMHLSGSGQFEHRITVKRIEIELPFSGAALAIMRFIDEAGQVSATYRCPFVSPYFRQIRIEHDSVTGVTPFTSAAISVGGVTSTMTVKRAFAEAGIDLVLAGTSNTVNAAGAGGDAAWSDAELLEAMRRHHSIRSAGAAWSIYLLSATRHESPLRLRGVIFDTAKRQGCATFHNEMANSASTASQRLREVLRTYVHEIGHCLNLEHPFIHTPLNPFPRHDALSWMNLPDAYSATSGSGTDAYWSAFGFNFDERELAHLRHGLFSTIIPGGNPFFSTHTADFDTTIPRVVADRTGLGLTIRTPDRIKLGAPTVVELRVESKGRAAAFDGLLHPRFGRTRIHIVGPEGKRRCFRPIASHCVDSPNRKARLPVIDSAYVGYGRDGFYFDWPGRYAITAVHDCPDGSVLVSNTVTLSVEAPLDADDAAACELFLGDEVGQLLAVLGSDSPALGNGRDAMALAIDRFPDHRLSDYARLVIGMNAARSFKQLAPSGGRTQLHVRPAEPGTAVAVLEPLVVQAVATARHQPPTLDHVSLTMAATRLGRMLRDEGCQQRAAEVAEGVTTHLAICGVSARTRARVARDIAGARRRPDPDINQEGEVR